MSSKVAVEKTGIGITKLISSLKLQQSIYGCLYTTGLRAGVRTDHVCTCMVIQRVDTESYTKNLNRKIVEDKEAA